MQLKEVSRVGLVYILLLIVALLVPFLIVCAGVAPGVGIAAILAFVVLGIILYLKTEGVYVTPHGALPPQITGLMHQKRDSVQFIYSMTLVLYIPAVLIMSAAPGPVRTEMLLVVFAIYMFFGVLLIYALDRYAAIYFFPEGLVKINVNGKSHTMKQDDIKIRLIKHGELAPPVLTVNTGLSLEVYSGDFSVTIGDFVSKKELEKFYGYLYYRIHPDEYYSKKLSNTLKT